MPQNGRHRPGFDRHEGHRSAAPGDPKPWRPCSAGPPAGAGQVFALGPGWAAAAGQLAARLPGIARAGHGWAASGV